MQIITQNTIISPVAVERDLDSVLNIYQHCEDFLALGPVKVASIEMVRADLRISCEEGGVFCGVYDRESGEMLAIVDFVVSGFHADPSLAFLSLLMIAAPHRGRGLGEEIVRAVEEEIRCSGKARAVESGVQVNNPRAIRFWQRMGYQIVSDPRDMGDGTTAYQLWKEL